MSGLRYFLCPVRQLDALTQLSGLAELAILRNPITELVLFRPYACARLPSLKVTLKRTLTQTLTQPLNKTLI